MIFLGVTDRIFQIFMSVPEDCVYCRAIPGKSVTGGWGVYGRTQL